MSETLNSSFSSSSLPSLSLAGKQGLIVGIANQDSIAWGCAQALQAQGAELAITYLNAKAEPHVRPLGESLGKAACPMILPLDVEQPGQLEAVFANIAEHWGQLDFLIHSIAYAPLADLHGRVVDCSAAGFARAMDVSCHSLIRMAKLAEPLMSNGGSIVTMSYLGAERVVANYNLMGPVKAALEATVRYLAAELGPHGIRVNTVSPGPIKTRAGSGIAGFDDLLQQAQDTSPLGLQVTPNDVGQMVALLVGDGGRALTGNVFHVDGGCHAMG